MSETPKKEHTNASPPNLTGRKATRSLFRNDNNSTSEVSDTDPNRSPSHDRHFDKSKIISSVLKRTSVSGLSADIKELKLHNTQRLDSIALHEDPSLSSSAVPQRHRSDICRSEKHSVILQKSPELSLVEPLQSATYIPRDHKNEHISLEEDIGKSLNNTFKENMILVPTDATEVTVTATKDDQRNSNLTQQDATTGVKFAQTPDIREFNTLNDDHVSVDEHEVQPHDDNEGQFTLAVELTPFKNKVGGHTAIFRFSHRAVCKALVNKENFWYETIEQKHEEILEFMPKYIGVLNVRYNTISEEPFDDTLNLEDPTTPLLDPIQENQIMGSAPGSLKLKPSTSYAEELVAEVVMDDNKHIIPESIWDEYSTSAPSVSSSFSLKANSPAASPGLGPVNANGLTSSPGFNSTGSTTVNRKLQEDIMNEVFVRRKPVSKMKSATSPRLLAQRAINSGMTRPHRLSTSSSDLDKRPKLNSASLKKSFSSLVDLQGMDQGDYRSTQENNNSINQDESALDDDSFVSPQLSRQPKIVRSDSDSIFHMDDEEGQVSQSQQNDEDFLSDAMSPLIIPSQKVQKKTTQRFEMFLLLEDLTADMKRPSVMDLKMGTRQYGVEAAAKKKKSQRKKCAETTSRQLGVRICGLQIWDKATNEFISKDKYFGREVKVGFQFASCIARFLYDGFSAYSILEKIPKLIDDVNKLGVAVAKLKGWRLYGSSLLLMYDGENAASVNMHIIDFAQCITPETSVQIGAITAGLHHPNDPDNGYLRGLKSIKFYLKLIYQVLCGEKYKDSQTAKVYLNENYERLRQVKVNWLEDFENILKQRAGDGGEDDDIKCGLDKIPYFALDDSGNVSE